MAMVTHLKRNEKLNRCKSLINKGKRNTTLDIQH